MREDLTPPGYLPVLALRQTLLEDCYFNPPVKLPWTKNLRPVTCKQCLAVSYCPAVLTRNDLHVQEAGTLPNGIGSRALVQAGGGSADIAQHHRPLHLIWKQNQDFQIKPFGRRRPH